MRGIERSLGKLHWPIPIEAINMKQLFIHVIIAVVTNINYMLVAEDL